MVSQAPFCFSDRERHPQSMGAVPRRKTESFDRVGINSTPFANSSAIHSTAVALSLHGVSTFSPLQKITASIYPNKEEGLPLPLCVSMDIQYISLSDFEANLKIRHRQPQQQFAIIRSIFVA
jgi:hypothetical protein